MNASYVRRRWFQLQLSTSILIVLTTGIWIGLNLRHVHINYPDKMYDHDRVKDANLGFPLEAAFFSLCLSNSNGETVNYSDDYGLVTYGTPTGGYMIFTDKAFINALMGLLTLFVEYALMEHLVRRRKRGAT